TKNHCVIRIACCRSDAVIWPHTISAFCFSAAFSGSFLSASAKYRYAVGKSRDKQCPVAYSAPIVIIALGTDWSAAGFTKRSPRVQSCGTPRPYKYRSPIATESSGLGGGSGFAFTFGFGFGAAGTGAAAGAGATAADA